MRLIGGAVAAWPLTVRAQQRTPVIGYLDPAAPESRPNLLAAFRKGLTDRGFVENQNIAIEYRWARDDNGRLAELATDLVRKKVAVIVTLQSLPATLAARAATTEIPIVFSSAADPVQTGLVASLNRPGRNVTGINTMALDLDQKRLGILNELTPKATRFALLVNSTNPQARSQINSVHAAGAKIGKSVEVLTASTAQEIDAAFELLVQSRADAMEVSPDPFFTNRRVQITRLASHYRLPAIYATRLLAEAGGLMSYGTDLADVYRQAGNYAGRILNGERAADMPISRPTKFEFVINRQTARTLGLAIPPTLLALADEFIE